MHTPISEFLILTSLYSHQRVGKMSLYSPLASNSHDSSRRHNIRVGRIALIFAGVLLLFATYQVANWQDIEPQKVVVWKQTINEWTGGKIYGSSGSSRPAQKYGQTRKDNQFVVIPVTSGGPGFCRTLFSLLINGYGPPTIVSWGTKNGPNHYYDFKIKAFNNWLQAGGDDSDMVVMIDGHDVWSQLPADIFFKQFSAYPEAPGIVIGAEKNCWPGPKSSPRCAGLPESPLPKDIYGDITDKEQPRVAVQFEPAPPSGDLSNYTYNRLETTRPRYVNSGTIVGTRGDLKQLLDKISMLVRLSISGSIKTAFYGDDQEMFAMANLERLLAGDSKGAMQPDMITLLFQIITMSYKDLALRPINELVPEVREVQTDLMEELMERNEEWSNRTIIWNHLSKTIPSFLHLPGKKWPIRLESWWSRVWWMREERTVTINELEDEDAQEGRGRKGEKVVRPVDEFYDYIEKHSDELFGFGMRLDNGTFIGFMDECSQYRSAILGLDMSWMEHPGCPYYEG